MGFALTTVIEGQSQNGMGDTCSKWCDMRWESTPVYTSAPKWVWQRPPKPFNVEGSIPSRRAYVSRKCTTCRSNCPQECK